MKKSPLTLALLLSISPVAFAHNVAEDIAENVEKSNVKNTNMVLQQNTQIDEQQINNLSQNIVWQRLLLYKNGKSTVRNADFFIAQNGNTDPKAELIASVNALQNKETAEDFLCRFPARSHWLLQNLPNIKQLHQDWQLNTCSEFDAWLNKFDAKQFSLIFAEEHNNRIGSSFGHTLVKIDTAKSLKTNNNDDAYFFNFATDETKETGLKGSIHTVSGKGAGAMTFGKYTDKQANYLINDQRDIWQYELDLPQDTINQVMRQLWEVKNADRYYKFLNNNCATEILRLLDATDEQYHFVQDGGKIIAPAEVSRVLAKHHLLKNAKYLPSERTVKQAFINNHQAYNLDYPTLARLNDLPTFTPNDNNPVNANKLHRATVAIKQNNQSSKAIVGVRGGYQDLLDNPTGKRNYWSMNAMSLSLGYRFDDDNSNKNNKITIEEATLIDVLSLSPKNGTDPHTSYGLHLKIKPVIDASNQINDEYHVLSVGMEKGVSYVLGQGDPNQEKQGTGELPDTLCYALAGGVGQVGKINQGHRVGVNVHTGCAVHLSPKMRVLADVNLPYWYQGGAEDNERSHYFQPIFSLGGQYDIGKQQAVRVGVEYEKLYDDSQTAYTVSYHWFFD